jgi:hypothetical protein
MKKAIFLLLVCSIFRVLNAQGDTIHIRTTDKTARIEHWLPDFGRDSVYEYQLVVYVPMQLTMFSIDYRTKRTGHLDSLDLRSGERGAVPSRRCSDSKSAKRHSLSCMEIKLDDYFGSDLFVKYNKNPGDRIRRLLMFFRYYNNKERTSCRYYIFMDIYLEG